MDALLQSRAQQLATEFASQATMVEELNGLMRLMMKSGLERMLDTEMDVHLGRRSVGPAAEATASLPPTGALLNNSHFSTSCCDSTKLHSTTGRSYSTRLNEWCTIVA
jgi:hypothetical protein